MYLFSCNATAKQAMADVAKGETMPFIAYVDFADLFGAEYLCKLYLMRAGFVNVEIEKRKHLPAETVAEMKAKDTDIQQALKHGYHLRMFDRH